MFEKGLEKLELLQELSMQSAFSVWSAVFYTAAVCVSMVLTTTAATARARLKLMVYTMTSII